MCGHCGCGSGWSRPVTPAALAGITSFTAPFAGAVTRPIPEKLGDVINAADLGFVGDDATDNAPAAAKLQTLPDGSEVQFKPGRYRYTGSMTINKQLGLRGHTGKTVFVPMTPNVPGIIVSSAYVRITDLFIERIVKPVAGGDGIVMQQGNCSNAVLSRLHVEKCYRGLVLGGIDIGYANNITVHGCQSHGIEFTYGTLGVMQWHMLNVLSQSNLGDGYRAANMTATNGIGPFFNDCISFNNGGSGFYFSGTNPTPLNDVLMVRCLSSFDALQGIAFDNTWGQAHMLHLPWVEFAGDGGAPRGFDGVTQPATNTAHGIRVVGSNNPGINIVGGLVWQCTWSGMEITSPGILINGMTFFDNGKAQNASITRRAGIVVSADSVAIDACLFVQNAGVVQQTRAIVLTGAQVDTKIGPANKFVGYSGPLTYVDTTLATLVGTVPAHAPLGLTVNTSRVPFSLSDETAGPTPAKFLRVSAGRYQVMNNALAAPIIDVGDAGDTLINNYIEMTEILDPANPAGNKARLYTRDNGAGKTQIVARFPTGGVIVIATEL
jgi:hypothetical protein